jgi:hypothetical protein
MSYFFPTCNILVYPTSHELDVRIPLHPVNILVVYLSPKQVVVIHSVWLFVVFLYHGDHSQLHLPQYERGVQGECAVCCFP